MFVNPDTCFFSNYQYMNRISINFNSDKNTLFNVIKEIKIEESEKIQTNIIKPLIISKILDKYKFNGLFHIVMAQTNLYSTK